MFPEKVKITDELISLIIETRKAHDLTAYQLSEKIGKNKSWLPNIENKRTKNISREDLYLLFRDFASKEDLEPEQYIVKNLPRNSMIELEGGVVAPGFHVKEMLDVDDWEGLSDEEINTALEFEGNETLRQKDVQASIYRLSVVLKKQLARYPLEKQEHFVTFMNIMASNIENDFERTLKLYGNSYCPFSSIQEGSEIKETFLSQLDSFIETSKIANDMMVSRTFIYGYIEDIPANEKIFLDKINNSDPSLSEGDKMYYALDDLKQFHFCLYYYIGACLKYSEVFKDSPTIEYNLLFSKLFEVFTLFIKVAKLNYSFDFQVPDDTITLAEIDVLQSKTDKILFEIEKELLSKFGNRISWIFP